jgi:hypothetical protein
MRGRINLSVLSRERWLIVRFDGWPEVKTNWKNDYKVYFFVGHLRDDELVKINWKNDYTAYFLWDILILNGSMHWSKLHNKNI